MALDDPICAQRFGAEIAEVPINASGCAFFRSDGPRSLFLPAFVRRRTPISLIGAENHAMAVVVPYDEPGVEKMLYYALVFLLIALVAAALGFGGIAVAFAGVAKILFFLFLILFLVSLVMHVGRRV